MWACEESVKGVRDAGERVEGLLERKGRVGV